MHRFNPTQIQQDILETLKCSMCDNYLSCAPIMAKPNGDSICGRCKIPDEEKHLAVRMNAYERLASDKYFPCRYRKDGCTATLKMADIKQHEAYCEFHELECPLLPSGTCPWMGPQNKLLEHYEGKHSQLVLGHPCIITPNITRNYETNMLTSISKKLFLVQVKNIISTAKLYHCVRYIGNPEQAKNYEYNFEISSNKGNFSNTCQVLAQENFKISENSNKEIDVNGTLILLGRIEDIKFSVTINSVSDSKNPALPGYIPLDSHTFTHGWIYHKAK